MFIQNGKETGPFHVRYTQSHYINIDIIYKNNIHV